MSSEIGTLSHLKANKKYKILNPICQKLIFLKACKMPSDPGGLRIVTFDVLSIINGGELPRLEKGSRRCAPLPARIAPFDDLRLTRTRTNLIEI